MLTMASLVARSCIAAYIIYAHYHLTASSSRSFVLPFRRSFLCKKHAVTQLVVGRDGSFIAVTIADLQSYPHQKHANTSGRPAPSNCTIMIVLRV